MHKSESNYVADVKRRLDLNRLERDEQFKLINGQLQLGGIAGAIKINEQLSRQIFDQNPSHEFFVEESVSLQWMYPHLLPYGIIMKINRQPVRSIPPQVIDRDHQFWRQYSGRLTGDVVEYDTSVASLAAWIEKTYLRREFGDFTGDRKFINDPDAQRSFSKLRSTIAGVYAWRLSRECPAEYAPKSDAEFQSLAREADFALRQAWVFGPASAQTVVRYASLLMQTGRAADARIVVATYLKLDPGNTKVMDFVNKAK